MAHGPLRPIRTVIDSNALQTPELRAYLARSSANFAVLNDYAAMEAYKGDTLVSIFRSMDILTNFPRQVIVLKTTGKICGLRGRANGLQRRMIDEKQTRWFPVFCRHLQAAQRGDAFIRGQLLENGFVADEQMSKILADALIIPDAINELRKAFTADELRVIRESQPFSSTLVRKLLRFITDLALITKDRHPNPPPPFRNEGELRNAFLFRFAVCSLVWSLDWIAQGGADNVRADRLRNDLVDVIFATYATYFDDFLSRDKKALRVYARAKFIVAAISPAINA